MVSGYKLYSTHGTKERAEHMKDEIKIFSPNVKIRVIKLTEKNDERKYGVYTRGKSVHLR